MENLGNWVRHAVQKHVRTQWALCSNYAFAFGFDAHWVLSGFSRAAPHFRQGCGFTPVLKMRKPKLGDTYVLVKSHIRKNPGLLTSSVLLFLLPHWPLENIFVRFRRNAMYSAPTLAVFPSGNLDKILLGGATLAS